MISLNYSERIIVMEFQLGEKLHQFLLFQGKKSKGFG